MIKVSNNFDLREFVGPDLYKKYGSSSVWFVRPQIVFLAQFIRDYFGKRMIINDWHKGGKFTERGFRLPDSKTGAKLSQHKLAGAIDFNIEGMTSDEVRSSILENPVTFMDKGLTTLEHADYAPTWVHGDIRWTGMPKILIVKPASAVVQDEDAHPAQDEYFHFEEGELIQITFPLF